MRSYPHKPRESDLQAIWQREIENYHSAPAGAKAAVLAKNENFFKVRGNRILDLACICYAFESSLSEVRTFLTMACDFAEKALEFHLQLSAGLYMQYLSLAIICRREGFKTRLQGLQRLHYVHPHVEADEAFYLAAEAMAALSAGQASAAQAITAQGLARIGSGLAGKLARETIEPVLLLEAAIAAGDVQALVAAAALQYETMRITYSNKNARLYPGGLLNVQGVALLAVARNYGLKGLASNVYMPLDLVEGMS